jgi:hypothetical protein
MSRGDEPVNIVDNVPQTLGEPEDVPQNTNSTKRDKRVQMKRETESRMDELVKRVGKLAEAAQGLARIAVRQYSVEVEAILKARSRDSRCIERCLDGMLDFCFDHEMLLLYKKLCRYYFDVDPEATASYVHTYREMWDEKNPTKGTSWPRQGRGHEF